MSTSSDSRADTLRTYVNDLLALDQHIVEALEHQSEDKNVQADSRTAALIGEIRSTFATHVAVFTAHVERLGSETGAAVKGAVSHVAGLFAGLIDKVRPDPVSKMLRDDYTALNLAAFSSTMLHTTALAFNDGAVAASALAQLKDLAPLIIKLNELVPFVVAKELTDDGYVEAGAAEEAVRNTQAAWQK